MARPPDLSTLPSEASGLKTLLLMRHGKSDWAASFATDHERPINRRGRRASAAMGAWLSGIGAQPEVVVSSSAIRARTTAERAILAGGFDAPLTIEPAIYEASARDLVEVVVALPAEAETAMLVGHEPGMSSLIALLTGASVRFPTAALARIDLEVESWEATRPMSGTLAWLQLPRQLNGGDGG